MGGGGSRVEYRTDHTQLAQMRNEAQLLKNQLNLALREKHDAFMQAGLQKFIAQKQELFILYLQKVHQIQRNYSQQIDELKQKNNNLSIKLLNQTYQTKQKLLNQTHQTQTVVHSIQKKNSQQINELSMKLLNQTQQTQTVKLKADLNYQKLTGYYEKDSEFKDRMHKKELEEQHLKCKHEKQLLSLSCDKEKGSLKFERDLCMMGNFFLVVVCAMLFLIMKRLINRQKRLMLRED